MQLKRIPGEGRLYELERVGTLCLTGRTSRAATAEARGLSWQITYRGILQPVIRATDAAGALVGEFKGRTLDHGGTLQWSDRELVLRPDSFWRDRHVLVEGDRKLATIDGKGWDRRPHNISVGDAGEIDPGLLLFAAFVVGTLAHNAQAAAPTTA